MRGAVAGCHLFPRSVDAFLEMLRAQNHTASPLSLQQVVSQAFQPAFQPQPTYVLAPQHPPQQQPQQQQPGMVGLPGYPILVPGPGGALVPAPGLGAFGQVQQQQQQQPQEQGRDQVRFDLFTH